MNLTQKVNYTRSAKQTRNHKCHWPGCIKQCKPAVWGCYEHWMKLPHNLRTKIWQAFEPGQEETLTPSKKYLQVADEVQIWIKNFIETKNKLKEKNKKDLQEIEDKLKLHLLPPNRQ